MKWYGKIGYRDNMEVEPGVWEDKVTEVNKFGDLLRNYKSDQQGNKINEDITVSNKISVVADPYLMESFHKIVYITFGGAKWKVSSVEAQYPRLIITLGSLYKEDTDDIVDEEEDEDDDY